MKKISRNVETYTIKRDKLDKEWYDILEDNNKSLGYVKEDTIF